MSRRLRIVVCSILVLFAFGAGIFAYAHTQLEQNDAAVAEEGLPNYLVDKNGKIRVPVEPATGDARNSRGTADNPFFVLEIVPYEGMAEFGYHISGCEPIDVDAAARDGLDDVYDWGAYYTLESNVTYRFWPEDQPATFSASEAATKLNQYGTMTYVGDGNGQYDIEGVSEEDINTIDKKAATYVAVAGGAFSWKPLSAEECYAMTTAEAKAPYEGEFKGALTEGTSFKMYFKDMTYVQGTGLKLTHKHTFLKESIGLKYAFDADGVRYELPEAEVNERIKAYKSVVYTVTPEDLNMNPELIDRADLVVISPKMNKSLGGCPDGMYTYLQPGDADFSDSKYKFIPYLKKHLFGYEEPAGQYGRKNNTPIDTFKTNLLDWSIVVKIAGRAMDDTHILPVVIENKIFQNAFSDADALNINNIKMKLMYADGSTEDGREGAGTQENMAKLYLMLCQMKSSTFKSLYGNPADASNVWFSSQDMTVPEDFSEDSDDGKFRMKNGAVLQTGVFHYDHGRSSTEKGTLASKVYWSDKTLLPWHILPTTGYSGPENYAPAVAMFGIGTWSDGYSMTSGDTQNSLRNGLMGFDDNGKMDAGFDSMDCGIKNGVFGAQLYQYFDTINGSDPMPAEGDLTTADCLFYLLNGVNGGPVPTLDTTQYKILELQPSSDYESDDFWEMFILAHTNSVVEPEVKKMTTSEFIGSHVECISEYDLIYVGMNKAASDPTMTFPSGTTNYVYAHTGPKVTVGTDFSALYGWLRSGEESGLTETQYNEAEQYFTYSGNDLTKLALTKLEKYNESGFPILFGDGFYSEYPKATEVTKAYKMADTIDRNSNIYKLGDKIDDAGSKVFHCGELNGAYPARAGQLVQTLTSNSKKVQMVFSESPVLYNSKETDIKKRYINGYDDTYRTLKYKFFVKAPAGTSYQVKLYVDTNTDGAYTEGREDIGAEVTDIYGHTMAGGVVEAGKTYTVERTIDNRIGSLPWKLDLVKDSKVYASKNGVSAILKGPGDSTVDIKVLQIVPELVDPHKTYTPDDPKCETSLTLPMDETHLNQLEAEGAWVSDSARRFYTKIGELQAIGLDVDFVVMNQTQVLAAMAAEPDYLYKNYDMLVLGFADIYKGVSDSGLITEIETFITRGKAVLYTHDTSSGIGNKGTDKLPVWGKTVTKAYRDLFGMDRYGAKKYYDSGDFAQIPSEKDIPYIPVDGSGTTGQQYTNGAGKFLVQGVSDGIIYRALYPEASDSDPDKNINSYKVNKVNTGAITEYPFTISNTIDIASTHPQYYQLDMESDDIVVWYCLDGGASSSSYENEYFGSKNDVRNNYYIYNKGNVTYSGMGHMRWDGKKNSLNLGNEEIELFINTFVAAYRAPAVGVPVEVVNDDVTSDSSGKRYLCVDVDSSNVADVIGIDGVDKYHLMEVDGVGFKKCEEAVVAESKRVYFKLNDTNAFGEENVDYKLTMKVDGSDMMLAVYKQNGDFMHGKSDSGKIKNSQIYYVDVPIHMDTIGTDLVAGKTVLDITVDLTYYIGSQPFPGIPRTTTIEILPRGLYDLN